MSHTHRRPSPVRALHTQTTLHYSRLLSSGIAVRCPGVASPQLPASVTSASAQISVRSTNGRERERRSSNTERSQRGVSHRPCAHQQTTRETTPAMGKRLQTVAAMACMKTLLMLFNFVFWLSGIAMLAVGIWMEVELYKYMELSTEFSATAPYVLIGTGALIIVVGSLACCCTVKGQAVLLYIYGAFLMMIFVMELGAGTSIYVYREKLKDGFGKGLNQSMFDYNSNKEKTNDFNIMQSTLHCCGNRWYSDWESLQETVPESCCINPDCNTEDPQEIYNQGCYTKVVEFLNANIGLVGGSALSVAFFPLLGVLLSCCLAKNINKAKYEQMA